MSDPVFQAARFDVHRVELPARSGGTVTRELIQTRNSVVILPMLETAPGQERVVLIRNERFAVGKTLWEIPAGTLEPDEDPLDCAYRELAEETGYEAKAMEKLTAFHPTPGLVTEYMHAYRATSLSHVGQDLDENERIEVEVVELSRALAMVRDGTIMDAKTIALLLWEVSLRAKD